MTPLEQQAADYLRIRRALGFKLERAEKLLAQYLAYLDTTGQDRVTVENALAWARLPAAGTSGSWWAFRLSVVRCFASYLHALDPAHEIPPADVLARRIRRAVPYLYTEQEICALMAATGRLRGRLRQTTYRTLIGLLAVTGMRVGEAIRLDRPDVDLSAGVVTVRDSKFGKSRELPLHPTTVTALREYLRIRDAHQHAGPQRRVPDLAGRNPADLLQRARDLPTTPSRRGPDRALVGVPPARSRSPPPVRGADAARLVSRRRRRATQAAAAEHVYGPYPSQAHVLVFAGGAGVDGDRRAAARGSAGGQSS